MGIGSLTGVGVQVLIHLRVTTILGAAYTLRLVATLHLSIYFADSYRSLHEQIDRVRSVSAVPRWTEHPLHARHATKLYSPQTRDLSSPMLVSVIGLATRLAMGIKTLAPYLAY